MASEKPSASETVGFLRRLLPRVAPYRGALAGAAVLLLFSTAIGLVFPLVVRSLLDQAFVSGSGETLDSIAVGPVRHEEVRAVVNQGQMDGSLLGMSYLQRFSSIEITGGTLVLTR